LTHKSSLFIIPLFWGFFNPSTSSGQVPSTLFRAGFLPGFQFLPHTINKG